MTRYFYYETEDYRGILATDGNEAYDLATENGIDIISGVDLYADPEPELISKYHALGEILDTFDEIAEDHSEELFYFCIGDYRKLNMLWEMEDA